MGLQFKPSTNYSYTQECLSLLDDRQLSVTIGTDFSEYARIVETERGVLPLGPPFDYRRQFMPASRGFWIIGRSPEGTLVHTQAIRLLDLRRQTLAAYMMGHYRKFPPGGLTVNDEKSWYRPGPGAHQIRGLAAYHGEVWLDGTCGRYRGGGLVDVLARLAFLTCENKWSMDYVFGFMLRSVARKGLAEREGYMHADPYCLSWTVEERAASLDCNMVYMSGEDIQHLMHVPLEAAA